MATSYQQVDFNEIIKIEEIEKGLEEWIKQPLLLNKSNPHEKM